MPRGICPNCNQVFAYMEHSGDYVHDCQDLQPVSALTQEDLVVYGKWEDYTGSGTEKTNFMLGADDKLQGTKSFIEGARSEEVTRRGNNLATTRSRAKLQYIELNGDQNGY